MIYVDSLLVLPEAPEVAPVSLSTQNLHVFLLLILFVVLKTI